MGSTLNGIPVDKRTIRLDGHLFPVLPSPVAATEPTDDDVRSDLRQLHADAIGFLRASILDGGPVNKMQINTAIRFLKEVPCPSPE